MNRPRVLGLAVPLVLVAAASAQPPAAAPMPPTVLLRFKPPVGTTVAYTMTMDLVQNVPGMAKPVRFSQTVPVALRVVARKDGATTLQTKTGRARVTLPAGSPMAPMKASMEKRSSGAVSTSVVDELGNLRTIGATGPDAATARGVGLGMMAGAQGIAYPRKALRVGETWTGRLDMGKAMGGVMGGTIKAKGTIPIVYRLLGLERRDGRRLASIAVAMKGATSVDVGASKMTMALDSTGTMRVDVATGLLDRMTNAYVNVMSMGAAGPNVRQSMTMTMTAR